MTAVPAEGWGGAVGEAVLDEVQKAPDALEKIKWAYDAGDIDFSVVRVRIEPFYLRAHSGLEVDLVLEQQDRLLAVEVKNRPTVEPRGAKGIERARKIFGERYGGGLVVYRTTAHSSTANRPVSGSLPRPTSMSVQLSETSAGQAMTRS